MIDELEQRLRAEFASRADDLPAPDDVTDLVIGRAVRVRRRRRVLGAVSAVALLAVAGSAAAYLVDRVGDGPADDQVAAAPPRSDGLSSIVDDRDIATADGERIDTGLAQADSAWEVDGGWLVYGVTEETDPKDGTDVVRFVDRGTGVSDLKAGGIIQVTPNERGDAVAVEWYEADTGEPYVDIYGLAGADGPTLVDRQPEPQGFNLGGMAGDLVWFTVTDTEIQVGTWAAGGKIRPVELGVTVEPLASIDNGLVLADISPIGDTLCPAVVDPRDGFAVTAAGDCYEQTLVYPSGVAISGDGDQAMVYVVPADPAGDDGPGSPDASTGYGEWSRMDLRMREGLQPTGSRDERPPVFGVDGDPVYAEDAPAGTWLVPRRAAG